MFLKSRYDILLGRPGVKIKEIAPAPKILVQGSRRSGKTTFLINDLITNSKIGERIGFFAHNFRHVSLSLIERYAIRSIGMPFNIFYGDPNNLSNI